MDTALFWKDEQPQDWEDEWGDLPEYISECMMLRKGDILSLWMTLPNGDSQEYSLVVVSSKLVISYSVGRIRTMDVYQEVMVESAPEEDDEDNLALGTTTPS